MLNLHCHGRRAWEKLAQASFQPFFSSVAAAAAAAAATTASMTATYRKGRLPPPGEHFSRNVAPHHLKSKCTFRMSWHKARHRLQTCGTTTTNTLPSSYESTLSTTSGGIRSKEGGDASSSSSSFSFLRALIFSLPALSSIFLKRCVRACVRACVRVKPTLDQRAALVQQRGWSKGLCTTTGPPYCSTHVDVYLVREGEMLIGCLVHYFKSVNYAVLCTCPPPLHWRTLRAEGRNTKIQPIVKSFTFCVFPLPPLSLFMGTPRTRDRFKFGSSCKLILLVRVRARARALSDAKRPLQSVTLSAFVMLC